MLVQSNTCTWQYNAVHVLATSWFILLSREQLPGHVIDGDTHENTITSMHHSRGGTCKSTSVHPIKPFKSPSQLHPSPVDSTKQLVVITGPILCQFPPHKVQWVQTTGIVTCMHGMRMQQGDSSWAKHCPQHQLVRIFFNPTFTIYHAAP